MRRIFLIFFLSFLFFGYTQKVYDIKIEKKPTFIGFFNPIKLRVNGQKVKLKRKHPQTFHIQDKGTFRVEARYLFNKKILIDTIVSSDMSFQMKFKMNFLYVNPIIVR